MISKTITKKYAGGLIVTVFKYNDTKQVKKEIIGVKDLREAVNVATV
mgnify:CR=1 FL=1